MKSLKVFICTLLLSSCVTIEQKVEDSKRTSSSSISISEVIPLLPTTMCDNFNDCNQLANASNPRLLSLDSSLKKLKSNFIPNINNRINKINKAINDLGVKSCNNLDSSLCERTDLEGKTIEVCSFDEDFISFMGETISNDNTRSIEVEYNSKKFIHATFTCGADYRMYIEGNFNHFDSSDNTKFSIAIRNASLDFQIAMNVQAEIDNNIQGMLVVMKRQNSADSVFIAENNNIETDGNNLFGLQSDFRGKRLVFTNDNSFNLYSENNQDFVADNINTYNECFNYSLKEISCTSESDVPKINTLSVPGFINTFSNADSGQYNYYYNYFKIHP